MTAVELGADICALARTTVRHGDVQLLAAETLDPAAFPGINAFTGAIKQARKTLKLPRRCRAVVWGLPDGAGRKDPTVKPLIAPLTGAGFRVERVMSPCNALAALARLRTPRGDGATCWLAVNRTGVAVVVVRPGQQLYAHSFAWDSNVGSSGSQARLLQRYSLVAFLAPEIRRAMNAARDKGTPVDAVVTCGNLPEIRSLTMPLIEELDVEVEALDSLDGLIVRPDASDRLADLAASLRIACAGAIARPTRRWDESKRSSTAVRWLARGAAAAVVAAVALIAWNWWNAQTSAPAATKPASAMAPPKPAAPKQDVSAKTPTRTEPAPKAVTQSPATPAPQITKAQPSPQTTTQAPPPRTQTPPVQTPPLTPPPQPKPSTSSSQLQAKSSAPASRPPVVSEVRKPVESKPPAVAEARKPAEQKPPAVVESRKPAQSTPSAAATEARKPAAIAQARPLDTPSRPADKPDAARARTAGPPPEPLKDPLPRVTAILVSSDRRMATIDEGRIISVGDALGRRVVVGIDERAVTLREPSGVQIRVGLGGRILGIERSER